VSAETRKDPTENFLRLAAELRALFESPDGHLGDAEFDALALRIFAFQFGANPAYAAYCRGRGVTPESVGDWRDIPAVPTSAFKAMPIFCGDPETAQAVFRTSGTSQGDDLRGTHYVADLSLYESAAVANFARHLVPDGVRPALVALVSDPELAADSSLSHMAAMVGRSLCSSTAFCVHPAHGVDFDRVDAALVAAVTEGRPVLLFGTAFAFVQWTDEAMASGARYPLPRGSRIMETGGFKGRSREVGRDQLYQTLAMVTGISHGRVVNEYGMTEMLSQFYEPVLIEWTSLLEGRYHVGPGWVRTRVLDPVDLSEVPEGEAGLLAHFDLANLGSVCSILTEDRGIQVDGGFRLLGRSSGAEPRGCSLTLEEFVRAGSGV
jgi:acyl-protein synthetase LuxE